MDLEIGQIITQIFAFLIMLYVLKRFGWKPLLDLLQERKLKIQSEFDQIASQKSEIKQLNDEYQKKLKEIDAEARHRIQEGVQEGRHIAEQIQQEAHIQSKEMLAKTQRMIESEMKKAKKELKIELVDMVTLATEKILREKLDDPLQQKLIRDFVEETDLT